MKEEDKQLTKEAFEDGWLKQVKNGKGFIEAYREVESEHTAQFGKQRYSDYKSFARSRDYKRKTE